MGGVGFEPTKPKQRIYSPSPLTTRATSRLFLEFRLADQVFAPDNQGQSQANLWTNQRPSSKTGANGGTRTPDRLITNQQLYQLSYASTPSYCLTPKHELKESRILLD